MAAASIRDYVPGYALRRSRQFRRGPRGLGRLSAASASGSGGAGAGDYLPEYAGNLDIMTAAATRTADLLAEDIDAARPRSPTADEEPT